MEEPTEDVRWSSSYRPGRPTDAVIRELDASSALFADTEKDYSAKLRRARLARQVRILGWGATDGSITKVKLMCRVPEIDRAAITTLFGEIEIQWFAVLPNGVTREVHDWNPSTKSWSTV